MGNTPILRSAAAGTILCTVVLCSVARAQTKPVQAGFYTPSRTGQLWDTWIYFHEGKYYMFYRGGRWDGHELATSDDGMHWEEYGVMIKPRKGTTWMGTGHIWKAPDFDKTHVIEGQAQLSTDTRRGLFFDHGDGRGHCLLLTPQAALFGQIGADGNGLRVEQDLNRDMNFGEDVTFRVVIKHDMMELYMNDYLMNLRRLK